MSHKKYRQTLLLSPIGDFRAPEASPRNVAAINTEKHLGKRVATDEKNEKVRKKTCNFCKLISSSRNLRYAVRKLSGRNPDKGF